MSRAIRRYMTPCPYTVASTDSLAVAHRIMRERGIRHLPVVDRGRIVGVVSVGDLHLIETIAENPLDSINVDEAMTPNPYVVRPGTSVDDVVETMARHKYGCAIVADEDDAIAGIFTTIDAMRVLVNVLHAA
jgi:predicted transcriptional regulator